jgi:uncharacterized damage-inducible protein DinB
MDVGRIEAMSRRHPCTLTTHPNNVRFTMSTTTTSPDRIEKQVTLDVPRSDVRKFLTGRTVVAVAPLYGIREIAASMRAVRQNTILIAGDIPEDSFAFRATPNTRSIAETLVHIAWLWSSDHLIHEELHLDSLEDFDFPALLRQSAVQEKQPRTKAEIIELLRTEGDRWVSWVEGLSEPILSERVSLPGGGSVSRFEMLLGTKEHELQHRAQLTVLERLIGVAPRFTGLA